MALLRLPSRRWGAGGFGRDLGSSPGPEVQSTSRSRLRPGHTSGPRDSRSPLARGPAGALARSIARRAGSQPAEVRLRLVGLHALVVREQLAQLRPSRLAGSNVQYAIGGDLFEFSPPMQTIVVAPTTLTPLLVGPFPVLMRNLRSAPAQSQPSISRQP